MTPPRLCGVAFSPKGDIYAVDEDNRMLEKHVFDYEENNYALITTRTFKGRPLAITYASIKCGFDFDGVVVTLDTRNIRFVSTVHNLEIRRTVYSYGTCSAIASVPHSQSLLVANTDTNSVDIINIYGVPMKRFDLPAILDGVPACIAFMMVGDREIVFISGVKGLHVMTVDLDHERNLVLTQRQFVSKSPDFKPLGVCAHDDTLYVANSSAVHSNIQKYLVLTQPTSRGKPDSVILKDAGRVDEEDPVAIAISSLSDQEGTLRLAVTKEIGSVSAFPLTYKDIHD